MTEDQKEKRRQYLREYYSVPENKAKRRLSLAKWRADNREKYIESRRKHYQLNRERILRRKSNQSKLFRKLNPEQARMNDALQREKRWEYRRRLALRYYQKNRDKILESAKLRQASNKTKARKNFQSWYKRNRMALLLKRKLRREESKHFLEKAKTEALLYQPLLILCALV